MKNMYKNNWDSGPYPHKAAAVAFVSLPSLSRSLSNCVVSLVSIVNRRLNTSEQHPSKAENREGGNEKGLEREEERAAT